LASFSLEEPLEQLFDRIASDEPGPAGGSVAALAVAMAAGLVAMAARLAREWPQASEVVERAETLRSRVATLAMADAEAYANVLEALRLPRGSAAREATVAEALSRAADVPLAIAEAASEVATLAALVAQAGSAHLRGDAVVAAEIAEAGVRGAAELVVINLGNRDEARVRRAKELAAKTREAARGGAGAPRSRAAPPA
jgi:formiminotetrahydrofolate cyclodeaminase